jgi:ribonuclease P protein component
VFRANTPGPVRFGFIVPKTVGIAVSRNLVRRRLKSLSHAALPSLEPGTEIVIRALPGAAQADWATLRTEISDVLSKDVRLA